MIAHHLQNSSNRMCIMCGKLRIKTIRLADQQPGTDQIADISSRFARKNWITSQTIFLRTLDFAVPVSTLDKPYWNFTLFIFRQFGKPLYNIGRTLLICLYCQPKSGPSIQFLMNKNSFKNIQRHFQTLAFFSING